MATSNVKTLGSSIAQIFRGSMTLDKFLERKFGEDKMLLGSMVREKTIGMVAGPRGGGKSWLVLMFCYSIAGGKSLEPWGQGGGVQVVYLDGEMRAAGLQERLQLLHSHNKKEVSIAKVESNLHIISRDCIGSSIGSIDTEEGQAAIDQLIPSGVKLIVVDNLSAWTSGGREDSSSWATIKNWLITKRVQGIAVLLVHHAGKNGQQRGSSAHEDLLDYSILLGPLPGTPTRKDTRFSVEHTKLRDHIPELRQRYEYSIWVEDEELKFECLPVGFAISANVAEMARLRDDEDFTLEKIGKHFGVSKSTVSRALKKLDSLKADESADNADENASE